MTSPSTTTGATPAPGYRCTSCGREFIFRVPSHTVDPTGGSRVVCRGTIEPICRDQLVPAGAGDQLGQLDAGGGDAAGHEITMRTNCAGVTANDCADGSHAFAREAACPR